MSSFDIPFLNTSTLISTLELGGTMVLLLDSKGYLKWVSDNSRTFFGITTSELNQIHWNDLICIDGECVWSDDLETIYHQNDQLTIEGYCDVPVSGRVALDLSMMKSHNNSDRVVLVRNITQKKKHQEELEYEKQNAEQLNLQLETEIQRANELAVMAERANIAKSVFLTSMSHEFRTPLNGVLGYSQILVKDKSLTDQNLKAARTIERCGRHLLSIINDVLDLSKVEAGKIDILEDPLNISSLVNDVVDVFRVRAQSKGVELNYKILNFSSGNEWVNADSKLIRQILINLIGNAIKFTEKGSVNVQIECNNSSDENKIVVKYSIEDTGAGIKEEDLRQVFEEFYQTEAFSGHKGGTGLGLAISRKLVSAMNGKLQVESEYGKGSCFFFELEHTVVQQDKRSEQFKSDCYSLKSIRSDLKFVQIYPDDLDGGVLARIMKDAGCCVHPKQSDLAEFPFCENDINVPSFYGISESMLSDSFIEKLSEFDTALFKNVYWIILLNSSIPQKDLLQEIEKYGSCILVSQPIDLNDFFKELYEKSTSLWISDKKSEDNSLEDNNTSRELSNECPDSQIINSMLFDAQIGDMRAFNLKLEEWSHSQGISTQFEEECNALVNSFKIDDLCQYLQSKLS